MKKVICLLLVFVMVLAMCPSGLAAEPEVGLSNFKKVNTYEAGQFTDVSAKQWYAANVEAAYELGLMQGNNRKFNPTSNISVIETIVTACRLHSIYHTGESNFVNGSPWYQPYVDYAVENGIIKANEYSSYNVPATRAQFVSILAGAFPEDALPAINEIAKGSIPDVPASMAFADAVYLMYNAGILVGNDDYGTFDPDGNINRVQAAAIITRMADASLRLTKTLKVYDPYPPVAATIQDIQVSWSITSTELHIGQCTQLNVNLMPQNARSGITWTSSDPAIASVSEYGKVTAHKKGKAVITATTYNGVKDTFEISVPYEPAQLQYALTADGKGYEIIGCDTEAYSAHIPATYNDLPVVSIEGGTFQDCINLRTFTVAADQAVFYEDGGVIFTNIPEKTLVCFPPAYDLETYYYAPDDTIAVAPYAFAGLQMLSSLTLQDGLKSLGDHAFAKTGADSFLYSNLYVYVPDSLVEIGDDLLQGQTRNVAFVGYKDTPVAKYAQENNIPMACVVDYQGDITTANLNVPVSLEAGQIFLTDESNVVLYTETPSTGYYVYGPDGLVAIEARCDLSAYQQGHTGEIRVVLEHVWSPIAADPNGDTAFDFSAQTGLYGAGYTEGEAILRGYDRNGNLVAMQYISGDFAFSFPGVCNLGVEGGTDTRMTVIPTEPVFISSAGSYRLEPSQWHNCMNGSIFQYFVVQLQDAVYTQQFAEHLNLLMYNFADSTTGESVLFGKNSPRYLIGRFSLMDASRAEQMSAVSFTFDGLECVWEDEHLKCMISSTYNQTEEFGRKASALLEKEKQVMVGTYFPNSIPISQILIDSSASWSPTAAQGNIQLTEDIIKDFNEYAIAHEMVHAIDQQISVVAAGPYVPSPWLEGRAEYISNIVLGGAGERGEYDWSFLSEEDKADFFHYYYYSTNRYTEYDVGHYFFYYICKTYGEDVSVKIMENLAALPEVDPYTVITDEMQEEYAQMFKQCVEAATEVGVFQNFVRDVIEK